MLHSHLFFSLSFYNSSLTFLSVVVLVLVNKHGIIVVWDRGPLWNWWIEVLVEIHIQQWSDGRCCRGVVQGNQRHQISFCIFFISVLYFLLLFLLSLFSQVFVDLFHISFACPQLCLIYADQYDWKFQVSMLLFLFLSTLVLSFFLFLFCYVVRWGMLIRVDMDQYWQMAHPRTAAGIAKSSR